MATEPVLGAMVSLVTVAEVTVILAAPAMPPSAALMTALPALRAEDKPSLPTALETEATVIVSDAHATDVVRSAVVMSEYVPLAMNCCVVPLGTVAEVGETVM